MNKTCKKIENTVFESQFPTLGIWNDCESVLLSGMRHKIKDGNLLSKTVFFLFCTFYSLNDL